MTGRHIEHDLETRTVANILDRPPMYVSELERKAMYKQVMGRLDLLRCGRGRHPELDDRLHVLDPDLQTRYDFDKRRLVVERFASTIGCWLYVMDWPHDERDLPVSVEEVLRVLHEADMRRFDSPAKYLEHKRARAAFRRDQLRREGNDKVLAVVDSMSRRQIADFIDVEEALRRGDRVTLHGEAERFVERAYLRTRVVEAEGGHVAHQGPSINPGMNPLLYRRKRRAS